MLMIRGNRVLTSDGLRPASLWIDAGKISRVASFDDIENSAEIIDAGDDIIMPGVIDTHVHCNEPGRTDWEGFETATRAAAAGGITTILDMPLNSIPPTTTVAGLKAKRDAARGKCSSNVEFIGGVIPGNAGDLEPLAAQGVRAFKCFLSPSGVDEFPSVSERDLRDAFPILAKLGLPLMVHAEDPVRLHSGGHSRSYADYLASRPVEAEQSAIAMMIRLMEKWPVRVHIVHLSSGSSFGVIREAKSRGLPITVETCPHYLTFAAEEIADGATEFKCAPPIRGAADRDALWNGLLSGDIDLIASDHSPCPPEMKNTNGDFFSAWGGIASLQLSLAAVWTGTRARGGKPEHLAKWMCEATARLAGLSDRKGKLSVGYDADVIVWDPDSSFVIDPGKLFHRHKVTPYAGRELFGVVKQTFVAGERVFG